MSAVDRLRVFCFEHKGAVRIACSLACIGVLFLILHSPGPNEYACLAISAPVFLFISWLIRDHYVRDVCICAAILIVLRFILA